MQTNEHWLILKCYLQTIHLKIIYVVHSIGFQTFFIQAFKIVVDAWKFSMLLLYILWDMDQFLWFQVQMNTATAAIGIHPTKAWLSQLLNFKMRSGHENTLEKRYAIKFYLKLGKNATETYGMLQTALDHLHKLSISFEWHKRFKKGRESVRDDERCGRSKEVIHHSWLALG